MKTIALTRITASKDICMLLMSGDDAAIETISALQHVNPAFNPLFALDRLLDYLISHQIQAYAWLEGSDFNDPLIIPEILIFNKRLSRAGLLMTPD